MSRARVQELLRGADEIWQSAYEGMTLGDGHRWRKYADSEVAFCLSHASGDGPFRIVDVGCGDGRHSNLFAELGHKVTGLEISDALLTRGRAASDLVEWVAHDAREPLPVSNADLVVALYDVLGSTAESDDDARVVRNLAAALKPGGVLVVSVMNAVASVERLPVKQRPTTVGQFITALEQLPASNTMEQTGAVFDPALLVHFDGVFYRKEQFDGGPGRLPAEYVVRDGRFSVLQLQGLLVSSGLEVLTAFPAILGQWGKGGVGETDGKEIVAVARKPG